MKTYDRLQAAWQILCKYGGLSLPLAGQCPENTTSSIIPLTKQKPRMGTDWPTRLFPEVTNSTCVTASWGTRKFICACTELSKWGNFRFQWEDYKNGLFSIITGVSFNVRFPGYCHKFYKHLKTIIIKSHPYAPPGVVAFHCIIDRYPVTWLSVNIGLYLRTA